MSQEDVRNAAGLLANGSSSCGCNGPPATQAQDQDLESRGQGQDGIVLERIASLSMDMFEPSDFTGRFSKIQSRSRKRSRILGGMCKYQSHL